MEDGEGDEDREGEDFLQDLPLTGAVGGRADPVGRDLNEVFKECDAPEEECGQDSRLPLQAGMPREGHEDVGQGKQGDRFEQGHALRMAAFSAGNQGVRRAR
jgi:hypothetical protein